ncbi:hypothetical protein [Cryobacterium sp. PAMC25264]|uniref:hypothetical protein n=1 Tax=Cryobacterium sp. PAMC25264 TaxID=2861288 RepID=UPI001C6363D0|nr:hypothetical protein [Cryobacterium sp. PAMC25264]QYF73913.1 hypothetical protein KY500_01190 [Cryobacterium sp. PAMC25264]
MTVDRNAPAPQRRARPDLLDRFLRYWVLWVTLGETAGFLAPTLAQLAFAGSPIASAALILAGAIEGAVLGWTQATVLRVVLPNLIRSRWVGATAIGAAAAWFVGLLPAEWADVWQRWPAAAQLIVAALLATFLLCSLGLAQWFELRRLLPRSGWWIAGSAAAWCAGLVAFFAVATPLWQPGQSAALVLAIGLLAAVLMALTMAVVSGVVLRALLRRARAGAGHRPDPRTGNESPSQPA